VDLVTVGLKKAKSYKGRAMKFRVVFVCLVGLLATVVGPQGHARGIRVDYGSSAAVCNLNGGGSGLTQVTIDSLGADFNPNVGIPLTAECNSTSGFDQAAGDFQSSPPDNAYSNANMYLWEKTPFPTTPLAQVMVYDLSSGDASANLVDIGGLTEIEFNYSACGSSNTAMLAWGGRNYSAPCSDTNISLLFDGGSLVGYLDAANNEFSGLPATTGWSVSGSTAVPEPDTLALLGCAVVPMLLLFSRQLPRRDRRRVAVTR
jgi:hypothetical protein